MILQMKFTKLASVYAFPGKHKAPAADDRTYIPDDFSKPTEKRNLTVLELDHWFDEVARIASEHGWKQHGNFTPAENGHSLLIHFAVSSQNEGATQDKLLEVLSYIMISRNTFRREIVYGPSATLPHVATIEADKA